MPLSPFVAALLRVSLKEGRLLAREILSPDSIGTQNDKELPGRHTSVGLAGDAARSEAYLLRRSGQGRQARLPTELRRHVPLRDARDGIATLDLHLFQPMACLPVPMVLPLNRYQNPISFMTIGRCLAPSV